MLTLRNPHSVLAALATRPDAVAEVRIPGGKPHGAWERVVTEARRHGCTVRATSERDERGERGDRGPRRPQPGGGRTGAEAYVDDREPEPLEALFESRPEGASGAGLWLALDQVQDPHNVGAIFRTAAFFGVRGIVMTDVRAASLTSVVYDVASGGVESVPFAVEKNLRRALEAAKRAGVWILGTSEHAQRDVTQVPVDRPWLLVVGNEEAGLRRLTLETCDDVCRVAPHGNDVTSLNVSVATGILIATLSR
ncbi:MAG: RNA methyltransferase [Dehalococcoidia bacterium]|nr:RNA methyltransferase [Dehalococcoidia bacterium]